MNYVLTQSIKEIEERLKNQSQIALAWKKFVSQEQYEIEIDQEIYEDWSRVRKLGLNHQVIPRELVSRENLVARLKKMEPVLELAVPLMEGMFEALCPSHCLHNVKFYDRDSILLHVVADDQTLKLMNQLGLKIGSIMIEDYWGNNGAGTCLLKKIPNCIVGQEHYLEIFKPWVCFDYPLHDTDGSIIGGINISVSVETANPLTIALLDSGVRNLEEQLREREFRHSVNQCIKAKERFYRQIINRVKQGIIVLNQHDQVVMANQLAVEHFPFLSNWENEQLDIGKVSLLGEYLKGKECIDNTKVEIGEQVYLISMSKLENEADCEGCRVLVTNDVTELEDYEKQNHHKDKLALVGTLASSLAHELRNPLTAVKGFIQLALARDSLDQKTRQQLFISLEEIERTNKLVSDFLLLGKPSAEKKERISLTEVVISSLDICEHHAVQNGIHFIRKIEKEEHYIYGDRDKLIQVFLNIISNGIDAMEFSEKKLLKINVASLEDVVQIVIADSGAGITQDILKKLGTPFFTTKENGMGLGLSIASNIINAHKGRIEFESDGKTGSAVSIYLPTYRSSD